MTRRTSTRRRGASLRYAAAVVLVAAYAEVSYADSSLPENERRIVASLPIVPGGLNPDYSLVRKPAKKVTAVFAMTINAPKLDAREWVMIAAEPPSLPSQTVRRSRTTPKGESILDASPLRRSMFRALIPADKRALKQSVTLKSTTLATLYSRRLVGRPDRARSSHSPLSDADRELALRPTPRFDYTDPGFQSWVDTHGLHRGEEEGEIDFARRVFLAIVKNYRYDYQSGMNRAASHVCQAGRSDCGGLAALFNATLRSEGVPARSLLGRWAQSAKPGEQLNGIRYLQQHAKAEFYAQGVGWVPVDPSSSILHDKSAAKLDYFGNDPGDFLTTHVDTHLVYDSVHFGQKTASTLQGLAYWVAGSGSLEGVTFDKSWVVR